MPPTQNDDILAIQNLARFMAHVITFDPPIEVEKVTDSNDAKEINCIDSRTWLIGHEHGLSSLDYCTAATIKAIRDRIELMHTND